MACGRARPDLRRAQPIFEVVGQATGMRLGALVFDAAPLPRGREVKIAWHITGAGPVQLSATNLDDGQVTVPTSGPDSHSSSSWHRPGDEWGSLWAFPSQGCWRITGDQANGQRVDHGDIAA